MILSWLGAKSLFGLAKGIWVAIALALVGGLLLYLAKAERDDDKANQEIGGLVEREKTVTEVLKRTEKGNEVREATKSGSWAAYDECLQSARTPANCVGLLPSGPRD